jgi:hypothetical protein
MNRHDRRKTNAILKKLLEKIQKETDYQKKNSLIEQAQPYFHLLRTVTINQPYVKE